MTLTERVIKALETDDESYDRSSRKLKEDYESADEHGKALLDKVFISLCGWSLETLIKANKKWEEENLVSHW